MQLLDAPPEITGFISVSTACETCMDFSFLATLPASGFGDSTGTLTAVSTTG